jgi:NitT/TauT family transport system permease protein
MSTLTQDHRAEAAVGPVRVIDRSRRRRSVVLTIQVVAIVVVLVAWQVAGSQRPLLLSTPGGVIESVGRLFENGLGGMALRSIRSLLIGFVIAYTVGVLLGFLMARYRVARVALMPYLSAFYSIPRIAIIPVMVVWFGLSDRFVVASVVAAMIVVVTLSTAAGVREVGVRYYEVAQAMQVRGWRLLVKILLPGSVPFLASGTKLAIEQSIAAVLVAEFLVGIEGVGWMLRMARNQFDAGSLFALALMLMVLGIVVIGGTTRLERRFSRWRAQD